MFITLQNWSFGRFSAISLQSAEYLPKHFRQFSEIRKNLFSQTISKKIILQFFRNYRFFSLYYKKCFRLKPVGFKCCFIIKFLFLESKNTFCTGLYHFKITICKQILFIKTDAIYNLTDSSSSSSKSDDFFFN